MKKIIFGLICLSGFFSLAFAQKNSTQIPVIHLAKAEETMKAKSITTKVRMAFNKEEVIVEMFDNPASLEFLSMLPLTMQFDDYANAEKIANLPKKLKSQGPLGKEVKGILPITLPGETSRSFIKALAVPVAFTSWEGLSREKKSWQKWMPLSRRPLKRWSNARVAALKG